MGYSSGALDMLASWIGALIQPGGSFLELGSQDINCDVPLKKIDEVLRMIHKTPSNYEPLLKEYFVPKKTWKVANLFRGSQIRYAALDLYPGDFVIQADLNVFNVPQEQKNTFDLITNFGTTEHVTDQVNVFRVIHDFLKPGGCCFHQVPFTGYYNHALYNYHPTFFAFLAHANKYEIQLFDLSAPHLPYNIPKSEWLAGTERWKEIMFQSGLISCLLKKTYDRPFELFTDYDRSVITNQTDGKLSAMIQGRYDLRVRNFS